MPGDRHAADYGLVSRPRLWWTRVPWHNVTKHPFTNHPVRWSQHQKLHRLHVGEPHQDPKSIQTEGLQFHQSVLNKQKVIPCFTTPAPSEEGRPAPKKLKGRIDPETKSRWLSDQRAFAPWQYSPEALMHSEDGLMHVPTPEVKEQLHMLPKGYTEAPGVAERSRHRLLANGWHTGVARLILYLVVTSLQQAQVAALPNVPRLTTLQWVVQQLSGWTPHVGPNGWKPYPCSIAPSDTMWQHCRPHNIRHTLSSSLRDCHQASFRPSNFNNVGVMTWTEFGSKWYKRSVNGSAWPQMKPNNGGQICLSTSAMSTSTRNTTRSHKSPSFSSCWSSQDSRD